MGYVIEDVYPNGKEEMLSQIKADLAIATQVGAFSDEQRLAEIDN